MTPCTLDLIVDGTDIVVASDFTRVLTPTRLALIGMPQGTIAGRTAVVVRMTFADGREILCQTTLRMLGLAVDGLRSRYGVEDNGT